ncbi:Capsule assembly protein Wzi [Parapedobacter indicus]|uniref:Capsule assembly protein Wzi n=2 Tax=Parapedobacter indicus TaxID=1477437 RepID=A0A1I3N0M6_9SPHI|nr:capsule assembly protein Wzi [Parapedobacter indicus]SFJ02560.1 Capsule assembly protein Wzi [Parapedobacter indicus]
MPPKQLKHENIFYTGQLEKLIYFCRYTMNNYIRSALSFSALVLIGLPSYGQTLPVGTLAIEDWYRKAQLLGSVDSNISFTIRPLTAQALKRNNIYAPTDTGFLLEDVSFQWMPATVGLQYNSTFPTGRNDGPIVPTVGPQTYFSAGITASYKFLSVQLKPEFVWAANSDFQGFNSESRNHWREWYRLRGNSIDLPERFGTGQYTKILPGQSSIRLNFHPLSIGLSTENLWWGPGIYNSLMMSNNAPGFAHLTLNTTRPIRTYIGDFEGQIIGGRLEASGYLPSYNITKQAFHDAFYRTKLGDWRYLSAAVLTYQPKWTPGLSLGATRAFTMYRSGMRSGLADWLAVFSSGSAAKAEYLDNPDNKRARDQLVSIFARWVIPQAHAEAYVEYGRNDHSWDSRDFFVQLEHSRAYIIGFRKLVELPQPDEWINIGVEVTQMEDGKPGIGRPAGSWYRHSGVRHGYTHMGQLLGAGINLGGNLQLLQVSWFRGLKQLGFQFEREVNNNDFLYVLKMGDMRRNWVNLSGIFFAEWDYQNFVFGGRMQLTRALNYQYELEENAINPNYFWGFRPQDRHNFFMNVSAMYRF